MGVRIGFALTLAWTCWFGWSGCDRAAEFQVDPALRPAGAGGGEWVAKVLLLKGQVSIRTAAGFEFGARPQAPLLRSDTIVVAAESFAVVQLRNNLLNRVAADQSLAVAELASLDAPASSTPIEQQLTGLLTSQERDQPERIVGWHARLSAAQSVAARDQDEAPRIPQEERVEREALHEHKAMQDFGQVDPDAPQAPSRPVPSLAVEPQQAQPPPPPKAEALTRVAKPMPRPGGSAGDGTVSRRRKQAESQGSLSEAKGLEKKRDASKGGGPGGSVGRRLAKDSMSELDGFGLERSGDEAIAASPIPRILESLDLGAKPPAAVSAHRLAQLEALVGASEFGRCLEEFSKGRPDLNSVQIEVRIQAGKVVGFSIQKQAMIQGCLTRRLFGRSVGDAGWRGAYRLTVRLR
jgi:hypothetical protein